MIAHLQPDQAEREDPAQFGATFFRRHEARRKGVGAFHGSETPASHEPKASGRGNWDNCPANFHIYGSGFFVSNMIRDEGIIAMNVKYRNVSREILEVVETAPIPIVKDIIGFRDSENAPEMIVDWPASDEEDAWRLDLLRQLNGIAAEALRPVEDRCQRIRSLALGKGPTSLAHVAAHRRSHEENLAFEAQPDDLCRSAWMYLRYPADFEDAEAFFAARQYRDFGKMYDSFDFNADRSERVDAESIDEAALVSLLTARLELPSAVSIRTLDLPKTSSHPASVMVIVRHGGPLSSVLNHKDNGMRGTIYFRPPSEATLIWTPADNVMEICGPTPKVRKQIGDAFAEVALKADLSTKPLNWRRYDLTRFRTSFTLPLPAWDDVEIVAARLIEVEMRLGNWSRRLVLRVTIEDDIEAVAQDYLGGNRFLQRVEGFSRLAIAIHYARPGDRKARSMDVAFGDTRSNLQSKVDPDQRMRWFRPIDFALAGFGDVMKRRAVGSSLGTTRRGPYAPSACWA